MTQNRKKRAKKGPRRLPRYQFEQMRRAIQYGVEFEPVDRLKVFRRDNWTCQLCNSRVDPKLRYPNPKSKSLDHVIPLSKGGPSTYSNSQLAHLVCNLRKGARLGLGSAEDPDGSLFEWEL